MADLKFEPGKSVWHDVDWVAHYMKTYFGSADYLFVSKDLKEKRQRDVAEEICSFLEIYDRHVAHAITTPVDGGKE